MVANHPSPPSKGAQTRQAILDAAITRFGTDGYRATSVADVARTAAVGGTVPYAYFPNKEALFTAALDDDAAAVINEGVAHILEDPEGQQWRETLMFTLVEAVDRHPLARRVLGGLEPHVTAHMLDIPALAELRKAVSERIRADQLAGAIRADIDPGSIGNGIVTIFISLLMSVVQFGSDGIVTQGPDVVAVFEAALDLGPTSTS